MELEFCKTCKKCCSAGGFSRVVLSEDDTQRMPECKTEQFGNLKMIKKNKKGDCPFLSAKGCLLEHSKRPLDCRMFPLTFRLENGKVGLYAYDGCPFFRKIPRGCINDAKKEMFQNISKWTKKEIEAYSKIKPSLGKLFPLKPI